MFEEKLIRQVKGGLLGIKKGTKTLEEVWGRLVILKRYNPNMFEELFIEWKKLEKENDL
jgi:hypothetical protein